MKIIFVRVKGIGNMVMFTPTLVALRKEFPIAKITFLGDSASAEVVRGSDLVDEIINFDLDWSLAKKMKVLLKLRGRKFDYSVMTFPSNKWQFNLFAFLLGARKRVTHSYKASNFKTLSFLQNVKVPAVENIHDVDQNLNLLKPFRISDFKKKQFFHVSKENVDFAKEFLRGYKRVIAMHPGCGDDSLYKRWPAGHFTRLIALLHKEGCKPLLIAGPGEEKLVEMINRPLKEKALVLEGTSLKNTAAVISRCSAFLSTDSGLGHIASAFGVPTAVVIGPTDHKRIAPYGSEVITKNFPCSPCKYYPFRTDFSHIKCKHIRCLREITPDEVRDKLIKFL